MKKNLARAKNPRALALNPDSGVAAGILSCQRRSAVDQDKVSKDGHTLGRFLENRFMGMWRAVARCDTIRFRGIDSHVYAACSTAFSTDGGQAPSYLHLFVLTAYSLRTSYQTISQQLMAVFNARIIPRNPSQVAVRRKSRDNEDC